MKQLVILSGKGGTGKTSVTAALAHLAGAGHPPVRTVLADADVDAANLELVLGAEILETHTFMGGQLAVIDPDTCERCGLCAEVCRFDAVREANGRFDVDPVACEGCAVCYYQCPEDAIRMAPQVAGQWLRSESRYGPLFHAALRPAQENSGKLVAVVKERAGALAMDTGSDVVLIDGPPGIGCPVIAAVAGTDMALVVTEPTAAGIYDLARALATTAHFGVPALVCVNKADLHPEGTAEIEAFCQAHSIDVIGHIPFDMAVSEAIVGGYPVTVFRPNSPASQALCAVWERVRAALDVDVAAVPV